MTRGAWGGASPLEKCLANLQEGLKSDDIVIPPLVSFYDLRWKFSDSNDSKALPDCTKAELEIVTKALIEHIQKLNSDIAIGQHREQALLELIK